MHTRSMERPVEVRAPAGVCAAFCCALVLPLPTQVFGTQLDPLQEAEREAAEARVTSVRVVPGRPGVAPLSVDGVAATFDAETTAGPGHAVESVAPSFGDAGLRPGEELREALIFADEAEGSGSSRPADNAYDTMAVLRSIVNVRPRSGGLEAPSDATQASSPTEQAGEDDESPGAGTSRLEQWLFSLVEPTVEHDGTVTFSFAGIDGFKASFDADTGVASLRRGNQQVSVAVRETPQRAERQVPGDLDDVGVTSRLTGELNAREADSFRALFDALKASPWTWLASGLLAVALVRTIVADRRARGRRRLRSRARRRSATPGSPTDARQQSGRSGSRHAPRDDSTRAASLASMPQDSSRSRRARRSSDASASPGRTHREPRSKRKKPKLTSTLSAALGLDGGETETQPRKSRRRRTSSRGVRGPRPVST